jgi:hypothetical protein
VYAWAGWVCVLSPSDETLSELWPLVDATYERAVSAYEARVEKAAAGGEREGVTSAAGARERE